jgi:transposase
VFSTKDVKKIRKIKRLLRQANVPRFLHHFGPKKYAFHEHLLALLVRESTKKSYRETVKFLNELGFKVPTYSALAKMVQRLPSKIWNALLAATVRFKRTRVAAIDGTFFSRNNASFHFLKRIKAGLPLKNAVESVALLDTRRKKWLSVKIRLVRRNESVDFETVIEKSLVPLKVIVADKASDSEAIHKFCTRKRIEPHIPPRRNVRKGMQRKKHLACFRKKTYHRRSIIEAAFSRLKRGQGGFVKNRSCKGIRAELMLRFVQDNLNALTALFQDFQQSPSYQASFNLAILTIQCFARIVQSNQ